MAAWTARVKKKKTDTQYKASRKQGWQGEPEPYSTIEIEIPTFEEQNINEESIWSVLYHYFQTLLALSIFLFVGDKIMNWFQPDYLNRLLGEAALFGQMFGFAYDIAIKFIYFVFKLPNVILDPLLR